MQTALSRSVHVTDCIAREPSMNCVFTAGALQHLCRSPELQQLLQSATEVPALCSNIIIATWNLVVQVRGALNKDGSYAAARRLLYEIGERIPRLRRGIGQHHLDDLGALTRDDTDKPINPRTRRHPRRESPQLDEEEFGTALADLIQLDLAAWHEARHSGANVLVRRNPDRAAAVREMDWLQHKEFQIRRPGDKESPQDGAQLVGQIEAYVDLMLVMRAAHIQENPVFGQFNVSCVRAWILLICCLFMDHCLRLSWWFFHSGYVPSFYCMLAGLQRQVENLS